MPYDPKSRLQEVIQSKWQTTPSYRLLKTEGPDHARRFTVQVLVGGRALGVGEGRSKQMAEKEAAQHALVEIEKSEKTEASKTNTEQASVS
jgi:ribonuclease-3